jgi:hypothetical protein
MIAGIDAILEAVREQVVGTSGAAKIGTVPGTLHFHVYGRDGVMGAREPLRQVRAHELGIVLEAVAPTQDEAEALLSAARSTLLHYGYPGRIATAGNLAFPFSPSDLAAGEVYEFSVYHLMEIDAPDAFPIEVEVFRDGRMVP